MAAKPVFMDTGGLYCDWTLTSQQQQAEVDWQIARKRDVREMVKLHKKERLKRKKEKFLKKKYSKNLRNVKSQFKKKLNFDIIQGDQGEGSQSQGDQGEGSQSQGDQGERSQSQGDQGEGDLRRSKPVSPVSLSPVSESPINLNVTMSPQSSPTFNIHSPHIYLQAAPVPENDPYDTLPFHHSPYSWSPEFSPNWSP